MSWVKEYIRTIPDYPKPGIMFRDVTTLMTNRRAFAEAVIQLSAPYQHKNIDNVAGIEARGFTFGAAIAYELGVGFVPIRKKGKLPFKTYEQDYALEYGTDTLEIHADSIRGQEKVLLIDDLIATGGTAIAAVHLLRKTGANVIGSGFVIDLPELGGSERLAAMGIDVTSLVSFEGH